MPDLKYFQQLHLMGNACTGAEQDASHERCPHKVLQTPKKGLLASDFKAPESTVDLTQPANFVKKRVKHKIIKITSEPSPSQFIMVKLLLMIPYVSLFGIRVERKASRTLSLFVG